MRTILQVEQRHHERLHSFQLERHKIKEATMLSYNYSLNAEGDVPDLPATEALNRALNMTGRESYRKPRAPQQRRNGCSRQNMIRTHHLISFDMADLINATEPLEEIIAFPKIEWAQDDEDESDQLQQRLHEIPDPDNDDRERSFHTRHSSPTLVSKRTRRSYHGRLVRSKSLKSSLCYLASGPG